MEKCNMQSQQYLDNGIEQLIKRYGKQDPEIWIRMTSVLRPLMNTTSKPRRPPVILFMLTPGAPDSLVTDAAETVNNCLGVFRKPLVLPAKYLDETNVTNLHNKIDAFLTDGRVVIFQDIDQITLTENLNLLHTLCDNDHSKHKKSCFLLTITLQEFNPGSHFTVEDYMRIVLNNKWYYLSEDRRAALVARIASVPIPVFSDSTNYKVSLIEMRRASNGSNQALQNAGNAAKAEEKSNFGIPNLFGSGSKQKPPPPLETAFATVQGKFTMWQHVEWSHVRSFLTNINENSWVRKAPPVTVLLLVSPGETVLTKSFIDTLVTQATILCKPGHCPNADVKSLGELIDGTGQNKKTIISLDIQENDYPQRLSLLWYACRSESKLSNLFWIFTLHVEGANQTNYLQLTEEKIRNVFSTLKFTENDLNGFVCHLKKLAIILM